MTEDHFRRMKEEQRKRRALVRVKPDKALLKVKKKIRKRRKLKEQERELADRRRNEKTIQEQLI